jgi:ATP-dependent Clp protease ATP-binding subunit ClpC
MRFRLPCLVIRHTSERVTVTPLDHPALALHAPSLEEALEDLTLALDDRITRAHPARVTAYASAAEAEPFTLALDLVPVWSATGSPRLAPLRLTAVRRPAQPGFVEVQVPRLDLRLWLDASRPLAEQADVVVRSALQHLDDDALLRLRGEGAETLHPLELDATPVSLNALQRKELRLDERPPAHPDDRVVDDWEPARKARAAKGPARPRTPTLHALGVALHRLARRDKLDPAWALEPLVQRLLQRVEVDRPEALVLVGESGVGKSAALSELARVMARKGGPPGRRDRPIFQLDASRLIAGDGAFGAWEAQLHRCLDEARQAKAVLYLGHIVELLDAGRSAHSDHNVAQVLGPVLAAREVTVIGEATPAAWAALQRRNQSFAAVWSPLRMEEPGEADARTILRGVAGAEAARRGIAVDDAAVLQCLALAQRFLPYGAAVGNAVTFARRLIASRRHARAARVTRDDATALFGDENGVALSLLRDDLAVDPAAVRGFLAERVRAQDHAVDRAAQVVAVIKAGLSDRRRPVAALFFAGPTGVGKTELAKALAEYLFGSRERLVRIDMGEYLTGDAVARLLGDTREAGLLPRAVRRQPFCVVLLDEVEKAHPAVFDALLGVLGEARLTDAAGRVTDFRNAVIVMTSNLGADTLRPGVGFEGHRALDPEAARAHYLAEARRFFRPELFNRLDEVVVFSALGPGAIEAITRREVGRITAREGLRRRDIALEVDDAAASLLAARGLDPRYGARPLKRTLERELVAPVAAWLADHPQSGPTRMQATAESGSLALRATALRTRTEGGRADAEAALHEAADLRAQVRRWAQSPAAVRVREGVRWFEGASRSAAFWKDRALADEAARSAQEARAVLAVLDAARRSAEASEDLAFEAWYGRDGETVTAVRAELDVVRGNIQSMATRLYLASEREVRAGTLFVTAVRGSWQHAAYMLQTYLEWARRTGVTYVPYVAEYVDPKERPENPGDSPAFAFRWRQRTWFTHEAPHPAGAALVLQEDLRCALFEGETGVHHVQDGASTGAAKVRWAPHRGAGVPVLEAIPVMLRLTPTEVIRRYQPGRMRVRDLRMAREFDLGPHHNGFDLAPVLDAWAEHRVLGDRDG